MRAVYCAMVPLVVFQVFLGFGGLGFARPLERVGYIPEFVAVESSGPLVKCQKLWFKYQGLSRYVEESHGELLVSFLCYFLVFHPSPFLFFLGPSLRALLYHGINRTG